MSLFLSLSSEVERTFTDIVENHAPLAWKEAQVDFSSVKICAGMAAPYGHWRAHYNQGLISFSVMNEISCFRESNGVLVPRHSLDDASGVLWHELAHHVTKCSQVTPWNGLRAGGSTHTNPAWCWAVAKAWQYLYSDWTGTPELVADSYRRDKGFVRVLECFQGDQVPPELQKHLCCYCGGELINRRSDVKFCGSSCRVANHRKRAP
jgi:hypothetical protein